MILPERLAERVHSVIFESDTPAGKIFDLVLLGTILLSTVVVALESVPSVARDYGASLRWMEWILTGLFTFEYLLRLACLRRPLRYARSFFGVVDFLSILPTWVSLFVPGAQSLLVVRALRFLRVFRILRLATWLAEARVLGLALRNSARKILVFLGFVGTTVLIMGALMYLVEGPEHGFTDIPTSVYWAIVTLTTVGFGDIAPATPLGRFLASLLMIVGYAVLAVPTGIVSVELSQAYRTIDPRACRTCGADGHDPKARFCNACGGVLD